MSASVHAFPRRARPRPDPVPDDAKPIGRAREVLVAPDTDTSWCCLLTDEGGGSELAGGVTKRQALYAAVEAVLKFNAEMTLRNAWPTR